MTNATGTTSRTPAHAADLPIVRADELDRERFVHAVAAMERDLFGRGAWSENAVREELDAPARTYFACLDADETVGYAGFWFDGDDAEIMTVGVRADRQRRGIAARLMERMIEAAREQGAARMLLEVRVDNDPALALYRAFGFTRLGLRRRYYQPEGIDAYTMALDLRERVAGFAAPHAAACAGGPEPQHEEHEEGDNR